MYIYIRVVDYENACEHRYGNCNVLYSGIIMSTDIPDRNVCLMREAFSVIIRHLYIPLFNKLLYVIIDQGKL